MEHTKTHHHTKESGEEHKEHHQKTHHQDDVENKDQAMFACEKCDHKFTNLSDLRTHRVLHDDPLEQLKSEIIKEVEAYENNKETAGLKRISWASGLVTAVLSLLLIFSLIQTVESIAILSKINSGDFKSLGGSSASGGASKTQLPSSLDKLPNMVGGC